MFAVQGLACAQPTASLLSVLQHSRLDMPFPCSLAAQTRLGMCPPAAAALPTHPCSAVRLHRREQVQLERCADVQPRSRQLGHHVSCTPLPHGVRCACLAGLLLHCWDPLLPVHEGDCLAVLRDRLGQASGRCVRAKDDASHRTLLLPTPCSCTLHELG